MQCGGGDVIVLQLHNMAAVFYLLNYLKCCIIDWKLKAVGNNNWFPASVSSVWVKNKEHLNFNALLHAWIFGLLGSVVNNEICWKTCRLSWDRAADKSLICLTACLRCVYDRNVPFHQGTTTFMSTDLIFYCFLSEQPECVFSKGICVCQKENKHCNPPAKTWWWHPV